MFLILTLGILSFALALILTPLVRDLFRKLGFVDLPDNNRKRHAYPIPRVGGIAIALAYVGAFAIALSLRFTFGAIVLHTLPGAWKIGVSVLVIFLTGLIDDLRGLNVWQKLIGQTLAAVLAFWAGVQVHIFGAAPAMPWLTFAITVAWLLASSNAFNLIDGMDGFAAGAGLFATLTMLLAALTQQNLALALVTVPLAGCLLGFLRYNFNPASVFLGDCGSLLIGFLLGCYGALWTNKSATLLGMTAPLMAMSIPLLDAGLSILRRFLRHQPIFGADRSHIHHKLLDRGLTPKKAVLLMYAVCGVAAAFSLMQNALHNQFGGLIVVLFCAAAWIGIQHLGYVEFAMAGQMIIKGNFRRIIDSQTRMRQLEEALAKSADVTECWKVILDGSQAFGFHSARMKLAGAIFEEAAPPGAEASWQLRIPLPDGQYVNFSRGIDPDLSPSIVGAFVKAVESRLRAMIQELEPEDALIRRMPVTTARRINPTKTQPEVPALARSAMAARGR